MEEKKVPQVEEPKDSAPPLAFILAVPYPDQDETYTGISVPTRVGPNEWSDD